MPTRPRILILDDEFLVCMALASVLERNEFAAIGPFAGSAEALAALALETPAAAMLDVNLGGGETSFAVADALRARDIPFLFLTGYSELAAFGRTFPGVQVLSKPMNPAEVIGALRRLLAQVA